MVYAMALCHTMSAAKRGIKSTALAGTWQICYDVMLMKEYQDHYFRKAKAENYPARSIYKLLELDAKFRVLARGMRVLDLGAAPGSWTLGASRKVGGEGAVIACDLKPVEIALPQNVQFFQKDVFAEDFLPFLASFPPFNAVISDMAPSTCGNKFTDQARSARLVEAALEIAQERLLPGGHFVAKIFMGPDLSSLQQQIRQIFKTVKTFKPNSSRAESFETFLVGLERKTG